MNTGIACFVKTPGLSPVKTRLAASIGKEAAESIYLGSVGAIQETLAAAHETLSDVTPYWAVAERSAADMPLWGKLPRIIQHGDGLGSRLHSVYSSLLAKHEVAVLIGSDSPQLAVADIALAIAGIAGGTTFCLGGAKDGGFYLMGGREPVSKEVWESIPYSTSETGTLLVTALSKIGTVAQLRVRSDLDEAADILPLLQEVGELPSPLPAQLRLAKLLVELPPYSLVKTALIPSNL